MVFLIFLPFGLVWLFLVLCGRYISSFSSFVVDHFNAVYSITMGFNAFHSVTIGVNAFYLIILCVIALHSITMDVNTLYHIFSF